MLKAYLDNCTQFTSRGNGNYKSFLGVVMLVTKQQFSKRYPKEYILGCIMECESIYKNFLKIGDFGIAEELCPTLIECAGKVKVEDRRISFKTLKK